MFARLQLQSTSPSKRRVSIFYPTQKQHIKEVLESDRGYYMCQVNTEPMLSRTGFLDVLGMCYLSDMQYLAPAKQARPRGDRCRAFLFSRIAFAVPPSISDEETSSDVVVDERNKMSLRCKANGYPVPTITWRREDGKELNMGSYGGKKYAGAHRCSFNDIRIWNDFMSENDTLC